jgi:hypothetical protein
MLTSSLRASSLDPRKVLQDHRGNRVFEEVLTTVPLCALLRVLGRYIHFNSVFGSGVANLAGGIGSRQDLFRDPAEPCALLADRSAEVASRVFFAAIDEFGDHSPRCPATHRTIAQITLRGLSSYFGDLSELDRPGFINSATLDAISRVRQGYGLCGPVTDDRLVSGIGFHAASETLADGEFCCLDRVLRSRFPEVVSWLQSHTVDMDGRSVPAYLWIHLHTFAEAEHAGAASSGVEKCLRYYCGAGGCQYAAELIESGMREFSAVQTAFMDQLLN